MTKELTASAPSGMIKVVAPPDNIILTVGAKRSRGVDGLSSPKINRLLDGNIFTVDAERSCAEVLFHQTSPLRGGPCAELQEAKGGLAVSPGENRGSHTVRSGQEPHTPGGTKR